MGKTWNNKRNNRNRTFSQKKREYYENLDLAESGMLDKVSNRQRIHNPKDLDLDDEFNYSTD